MTTYDKIECLIHSQNDMIIQASKLLYGKMEALKKTLDEATGAFRYWENDMEEQNGKGALEEMFKKFQERQKEIQEKFKNTANSTKNQEVQVIEPIVVMEEHCEHNGGAIEEANESVEPAAIEASESSLVVLTDNEGKEFVIDLNESVVQIKQDPKETETIKDEMINDDVPLLDECEEQCGKVPIKCEVFGGEEHSWGRSELDVFAGELLVPPQQGLAPNRAFSYCGKCGKGYRRKGMLDRHMRTAHNERQKKCVHAACTRRNSGRERAHVDIDNIFDNI